LRKKPAKSCDFQHLGRNAQSVIGVTAIPLRSAEHDYGQAKGMEGAVKKPNQGGVSKVGLGKRLMGGVVVTLCASSMATLTPTKASAFDVGGLIGAAIAMHYGAYHHGGGVHYSKGHVASRHDSDSTGRDTNGGEKDARDVDAVNLAGKSDAKMAHNQSYGPSHGTLQASERDAAADEAAAGKSYNDAPTFRPTR
jgi:hypothetical protein